MVALRVESEVKGRVAIGVQILVTLVNLSFMEFVVEDEVLPVIIAWWLMIKI